MYFDFECELLSFESYKIKFLELFSGTKSVGKVAEQLGYEVTSLDLKNADTNYDIMNWNSIVYESG